MRRSFKQGLQHFFTLTRREQRGIIVLLFLLLFLFVLNAFWPVLFLAKKENFSGYQSEVASFIRAKKSLQDSLKLKHLQKTGKLTLSQARQLLHPVPVNPDTVSVEQWIAMGLLPRQAKTIRHYLAKGGRFRKKEDLKKIHGLSPAEYTVLAPFIQIKPALKSVSSHPKYNLRKTEINRADSAQWVHNLQLPPWLAKRIVKYRHLLGGFYSPCQLQEVYGVKKTTYNRIRHYVFADTTQIKRINLNTASFKQLLHHPYMTYEMTKKLVRAREETHGFQNLEQVKRMTGFPDTTFNKIRHYLYLRPFKN